MSDTALNVINGMLKRINQPTISAIAGSTDPKVLKLYQMLIDVSEECRQACAATVAKKSYSFSTAASTRTYQLPKDFYTPLPRTQWNTNENNLLIGPNTDFDFTLKQYGEAPSTTNYSYRLFGGDTNPNSAGGQFSLDPVPSSVQTLVIEYVTRDLFKPQNWEPSTAYTTADYVNANGINFKYSGNGTSGTTAPTAAGSDGTATITVYDSAYETVIADTDLCVYDADLLKIGLRAAYMKDAGGAYQAVEQEFKQKLPAAARRHRGTYISNFAGTEAGPRYRVPYRGWSL